MHLSQDNVRIISLCSDYCNTLLNCEEMPMHELTSAICSLLPQIYRVFLDTPSTDAPDPFFGIRSGYVDEDYYNAVRLRLETLFGADDTFLETFEEDMKYSDTPIAASISESLTDIFQPLFNFSESVRESEGEAFATSFAECREAFNEYWSQTLCNVMRPLNQLRLTPHDEDMQP